MKNEELWIQYKEYTHELTNNCRKLAFGAAALCWIFKSSNHLFPPLILLSLGFVVGFFVCDILQYIIAALLLRMWTRSQEKAKFELTQTIQGDYDKPVWLDYPVYVMWWVKIGFLLAAYFCIGFFLLSQ